MNSKNLALKHEILEYRVGSHLYGTNTENSDLDLCGIFIAPKEYYIGLSNIAEVDFSTVVKKENGRNAPEAVDRKFYELRKFIKLATDNNPNIIEQLFINQDNIIFASPLGKKLLENRHLFPHKGLYKKFIGYSLSQKSKMIVKRDNMADIIAGIDFFKSLGDPSRNYVVQYKNFLIKSGIFKNIEDTGIHIRIGDTSIQKNETIKQALRKLEDRRSKFSGRYDDFVSKHGYDTKFASNLIRLLCEGKELLETSEIQFPLKERELILDVKQGKYDIDDILEMARDLDSELKLSLENSDLPDEPQTQKIEDLLIELVEESWERCKK